MTALLELARLFAKIYASQRNQAKVSLIFLLTAGGKVNYIGSKKYIEENLDNVDNSPLSDAQLIVSLEALAAKEQDGLYMHVSKVPKEKTPVADFFKTLRDTAGARGRPATMNHKKINLNEETLAFEHERFTFRRLPAFTISVAANHKSAKRSSMFDTCADVDLDALVTNVEAIAEALASHAFSNLRDKDLEALKSELKVSPAFVKSTFKQICSQARSQQLLFTTKQKGKELIIAPFVSSLEALLKKSVKNTNLRHFKVDPRDPEVVFYEPLSATLAVYRCVSRVVQPKAILTSSCFSVKHALFDLVVSIGIAAYLTLFYYFLTVSSVRHWFR